MTTRSLRSKLLVLFLSLIAVTVISVVVATLYAARNEVVRQTERELDVGARVLAQVLYNRQQELLSSAVALTEDASFKQNITHGDKDAITLALKNHAKRIHADIMLALSPDNLILAATAESGADEFSAALQRILKRSNQANKNSAIAMLNDDAYQLMLLPIRTPALVAYVAVGFKMDSGLTNNLKELTRLNVSLVDTARQNRIVLTTLDRPLDAMELQQTDFSNLSSLSEQPLFNRTISLSDMGDNHLQVVLSVSAENALSEYRNLKIDLLWIAVIAAALATISVGLMAEHLTKPLNALADAARRIASGQYGQRVMVEANTREIDALAESLNQMQLEIASREEHILFQAAHDTLTGLLNRTELVVQLNRALKVQTQAWALVCINIDHFRQVNETFGHMTGDFALRSFSQRLREITPTMGLTARLGADEFLILLPLRSSLEYRGDIDRVREKLAAPYQVGDLTLPLSFSIGVAVFPEHGQEGEILLRRAHIALDMARGNKTAVAHYEHGLDETRMMRIRTLNDLRRALSAGDQFELHFQPKLELMTGKFPHAEALLRWRHPVDGMIRPDIFIPLAEQAGLIRPITHWVIRQAVKQVRSWQNEGVDLGISLNLSAQDLSNEDVVKVLADALAEHQIAPSLITCEITESTAMENASQAIKLLLELRNLGVRLSIDDFGTGYSSMAQLRHLPVDELKIDKGFVLKLERQPDDQTIVRTTIELGHNFGLKVVAEGVENAESLALLRRLGCDYAQGFYLSKPLPAAALADWWRANSLPSLPIAKG
ncbi:MAG TPA: EAL domain-containing protein, partial [Pseudomonadales bacterium]|nr:EAL domain-containing protein [Pseudomonadales bacterium]